MKRRLRDEGGGDGGGGGGGEVFGGGVFGGGVFGGGVFGGGVFGGSVMFSGDGVGNGVRGGLSWSHRAEGKDSFVKCDMTGNDDFVGVQVKALISMMIVRVPKKDRWCGARGKFVRWKGVRVTKAFKRAKVGVREVVLVSLCVCQLSNQFTFWSLPSCAGNQLRNVSKRLKSELQSSKKRHIELVEQCESLKKGSEDSRKLLKLPMKLLTDGQTISLQCVSGFQRISLRPKNNLNTCTMK
nr:meiotic nuclear division protein 1 homolog isoform X1 [Tanacetum cinerariifolium]